MNNSELRWYRQELDRFKGKREQLQKYVKVKRQDLQDAENLLADLIEARLVVAEAARRTQANVKDYIESLTTTALQGVFNRPYKFIAEMGIRANKSECTLMVQEGDWEPYVPKEEQGGGTVDIISFALQIVLWSLQEPRSRPVFFMDEPMKWVGASDSVELSQAVDMMKEVSEKLGFQLILTTHEAEFLRIADKVFTVTRDGEKSTIEESGDSSVVERKTPILAERDTVLETDKGSVSSRSAGSTPALRSKKKRRKKLG